MSKVLESSVELIGKTPVLKVSRYAEKANVKDATILAKLEYLNPAGSVKDRIALAMIEEAEKSGVLNREQQSLSQRVVIRELVLQQWQQQKVIKQS